MPEEGVEPTHSCLYGILSPARLPVPPLRLELFRITAKVPRVPEVPGVPRAGFQGDPWFQSFKVVPRNRWNTGTLEPFWNQTYGTLGTMEPLEPWFQRSYRF